MRKTAGLGAADPILTDIYRSVKAGHFDRKRDEGPSKLEMSPTLELLAFVSTMSPERRKIYLGQIGHVPHDRIRLSDNGKLRARRPKRTKLSQRKGIL